jgi:hypothetical protein
VIHTGSDSRTVGHQGSMTLVTPTRVASGIAGNLAITPRLKLNFVPEPSGVGLVALAVAALLAGRRRSA